MIIKYTQKDLDFILNLAKQRNNPKELHGVHSKKHDPKKSEIQVHLDGLHGELAFSKYSGLPIRTDISLSGEKLKGKWDFKLEDDKTVEVRYRCKRWYEFALNNDNIKSFTTNIGVLVVPGSKEWTLEIIGWCTKQDFIEHHHVANFHFGNRLVIANNHLRKLEEEPLVESDSFLAGIGV